MKISWEHSKKRSGKLKKTAKRLAAYSAAAAATAITTQDRSANADEIIWDIADIIVEAPTPEPAVASVWFNMVNGYTAGPNIGSSVAPAPSSVNGDGRLRLAQWISYANPYLYMPSVDPYRGFLSVGNANVDRLSAYDPIGAGQSQSFGPGGGPSNNSSWGRLTAGDWGSNGRGFVGVSFSISGAKHYGWVDITRYPSGIRFAATLHAFGYNDTPGATSFAGGRPGPELTLEVNTRTGAMTLLGQETEANDINFYEITSAGNSLDDENWLSLEDQDFDGNGPPDPLNPGNGWEESGDVGSHALAEGYLLGNSTIDANASVSLGMGYDVDVDAQDLEFRFRTVRGSIFEGLVEYITPDFEADFDQDGDVDGDDFLAWQGGFGTPSGATKMDGDYDNDGDVDGDDFLGWQDEFGSPGEGGSQGTVQGVPEPNSILLLAAGAAGLGVWRRRRAGKA